MFQTVRLLIQNLPTGYGSIPCDIIMNFLPSMNFRKWRFDGIHRSARRRSQEGEEEITLRMSGCLLSRWKLSWMGQEYPRLHWALKFFFNLHRFLAKSPKTMSSEYGLRPPSRDCSEWSLQTLNCGYLYLCNIWMQILNIASLHFNKTCVKILLIGLIF